MHQIEIDVVELQLLQAGGEGVPDGIRRQVFIPDFCRDMQIFAGDARSGDGIANGFLVAVSICR